MGQESTPIQQRYLARQSNEPQNVVDGFMWINPSGGVGGNNVERYNWNEDAGVWELQNAVGPDSPLHPATGAMWRDTGLSTSKVYDGGEWVTLSPSNTQPKVDDPTVMWRSPQILDYSGVGTPYDIIDDDDTTNARGWNEGDYMTFAKYTEVEEIRILWDDTNADYNAHNYTVTTPEGEYQINNPDGGVTIQVGVNSPFTGEFTLEVSQEADAIGDSIARLDVFTVGGHGHKI